jgi:GNAT superfamily N-acetyltransferase
MNADVKLRPASLGDISVLQRLIRESVRVLQVGDYTEEQREAALRSVYGVDTELILDGTYFAAELGDQIVACGGWSRRKTLYGGDHFHGGESGLLDPKTDAAKIRAFFVRPGYERRGIGSMLMRACEEAARAQGFSRLELGSTITGIALYQAHGFEVGEQIDVPIGERLTMPVVRMTKRIG